MRKKQMMRRKLVGLLVLVGVACCGSLLFAPGVQGQEGEKKPTIKDVMKKAHKKPDELLKKVATGAATEEQKQELLKLYKAMAELKPPKGDLKAWQEKTKLLVDAADAAVKGNPDAPRRLTAASNCMACHKDHK